MADLGASGGARLPLSYVLPLRWTNDGPLEELSAYLRELAQWVEEVLVVDGSPPDRFHRHARHWRPFVTHLAPDPDLRFLNGKVNGVITGVRRAAADLVVIADDDVRYDHDALVRVAAELRTADLVRPQNYFSPLPWHARWDTARILVARATGGDFPGTLAVRRAVLESTGGYDGDVLFENLELVRTVAAAGGVVRSCPDCYVRRVPPDTARFWSQRVRQAYDELARPARLAVSLAVLPTVVELVRRRRLDLVLGLAAGGIALAEGGRRVAGGRRVFPLSSSLLAPVWCLERAACAWLAMSQRVLLGGCSYAGRRIGRAASSPRALRRRLAAPGRAAPATGAPPVTIPA